MTVLNWISSLKPNKDLYMTQILWCSFAVFSWWSHFCLVERNCLFLTFTDISFPATTQKWHEIYCSCQIPNVSLLQLCFAVLCWNQCLLLILVKSGLNFYSNNTDRQWDTTLQRNHHILWIFTEDHIKISKQAFRQLRESTKVTFFTMCSQKS